MMSHSAMYPIMTSHSSMSSNVASSLATSHIATFSSAMSHSATSPILFVLLCKILFCNVSSFHSEISVVEASSITMSPPDNISFCNICSCMISCCEVSHFNVPLKIFSLMTSYSTTSFIEMSPVMTSPSARSHSTTSPPRVSLHDISCFNPPL